MGVRTFVAKERQAIRFSILWLLVAIFFLGYPLPWKPHPPPSPAASLKWLGGIFSCAEFSDHSSPGSTLLLPVYLLDREGGTS